jgi:adenylate cyclase
MSKPKRRLAAIMFTDLVGYTALMGSDEDRALEVLAKHREIHSKLIEKYYGSLIKEIGSDMPAGFGLASEEIPEPVDIPFANEE